MQNKARARMHERSECVSALEHFPAKWTPVCVAKMRQNKELEPRSDSIGAEKALVHRSNGGDKPEFGKIDA